MAKNYRGRGAEKPDKAGRPLWQPSKRVPFGLASKKERDPIVRLAQKNNRASFEERKGW